MLQDFKSNSSNKKQTCGGAGAKGRGMTSTLTLKTSGNLARDYVCRVI